MPDPAVAFNRIAILGTGLIGGSFALALRRQLPSAHLAGFDREPVLRRALEMGAIDEPAGQVSAAVDGADLIYVALPLAMSVEVLGQIARQALPRALVTDASSTKRAICRVAAQHFRNGALFLGGHPMAGKEISGIAAADAQIFRGAAYLLVPPEAAGSGARSTSLSSESEAPAVSEPRIAAFAELLRGMGARPRFVDAGTHDWAVAIISQLPQLAAIVLADVIAAESDEESGLPLSLAGPGARHALRLASSPYAPWRDIAASNADNLSRALERMAQAIEQLRQHLKSRELEAAFRTANRIYKSLEEMQ